MSQPSSAISGVKRQRWVRGLLVAIVLWAAFLRLWRCDSSLPGLQIDEAYNTWNAYCLLKTGTDEWGHRWPIFYTRGFNDYRSAMYLYLLMPFEAIGGPSVCTAPMPAAIGGVITVALVYWLGRRMFDARVGLIAAALLSIAPWHIQHTRWGHEGSVGPLLAALSLIALIWSGAPIVDSPERPRAWRAIVAGLVLGVSCYGYAAVRVFLPVTLVLMVIATARRWIALLSTREGRRYCAALAITLLVVIGPLAWRHLVDPNINARVEETRGWEAGDSVLRSLGKILMSVPRHFDPRTLFMRTHNFVPLEPPGDYGWLNWFMLPLMLAGVVALLMRARTSLSARLTIVLFIFFAAGDYAFGGENVLHPIRSFPGIIGIMLTAAAGLAAIARWLATRGRVLAEWSLAAIAGWILVSHVLFVVYFFGPFNDETPRLKTRRVDVQQACEWLKPRLDGVDAVYFYPGYVVYEHVMVWLDYPPRQWLADEKRFTSYKSIGMGRDLCTRIGKLYFWHIDSDAVADLADLKRSAATSPSRPRHIVLILTPANARFAGGREPSAVIDVQGSPSLLVYELNL